MTRIQNCSSIIRLTSLIGPCVKFHLRLSVYYEAVAFGIASLDMALNRRAEVAPLDWIPVDNWLCAMKLRGLCRITNRHFDRHNLFVVPAYAPTDFGSDKAKVAFYQKLHGLLRTARVGGGYIAILAEDVNARVGRLSLNEAHLAGHFGFDSCRS